MPFHFQRRRLHYYHRFRFLLPLISAISGALLILFALLLVLAPSPLDVNNQLRHSSKFNVAMDDDAVAAGLTVFRVPSGGGRLDRDLWSSRNSKFYYGCSNATKKFPDVDEITRPNRYLAIATSGGLNQQRTGITDAVVAARILNASLVVPKLDQKSFWKDASNFSEIFDVGWFMSFLSKDVKIIKQLPRRGGKMWTPSTMRVPRKCSERCYQNRVLPVLLKRHAVQLNKFDYRLANRLNTDLQKLRCRVNYHALKFTDPIQKMAKKLVHRMRMRSKHYIALHLRYEPDMLAFSGCYYGGGDKERKELGAIRKRWKTLHISNPDKPRRHGRCPLTPEEVGLMLRALGYGSDVHIYVASGEVYGGEETLAPLKALFPNFYSKETIATKEELEPFYSFSSRMAALDFIVCDESDVFVTNNNGNMAKILAGRRRYFGHKPTIRPNAKKLYHLFLSKENMTWGAFASNVRTYQRGFMGEPNEVRPGRGGFHENPYTCICEDSQPKAKRDVGPRKYGKSNNITRKDEVEFHAQNMEGDSEWPDTDEDEYESGPLDNDLLNRTGVDYDAVNSEEPELEEMLSD
ncbi:O-fucosyltransferase 16 [Pyrus x bretschneideri]|uniref:O-fucosyltransferase 16 n=1 Tax=Pyrus x bretschneideri TaxID=225117 RepID=UPI00202FBE06|nr:O-fucosyltransferase 16 [Pyrus x bretschneideri]